MELFYLIYMSRAARKMRSADLDELMDWCVSRNRSLDVTGMLLFVEERNALNSWGRFVQVLEGPEETVRNLYNSIRKDSRHREVTELFTYTVGRRNFPDWSMGFKRLAREELPPEVANWFDPENFPRAAESGRLNIPLTYLHSFYDLYRTS
ncbi:BLUF domain-containing protein [Mucilaginibacter conchicola]|uniref:BLUF domain-containing protein n=1 Tax=Mucilaginibacter conchicola TaxID=2303333 RepID=A0A372NQQ0_9SPHI|nr:BLUF domain-containing protein [Mucilaginibacter conchicola]RFZ91242.1 BLUF domain-containing protein [Mucilaginibacter conchicola]